MIRPAKEGDAAALTRISFAAKRYWGYPENFFALWKNELTVRPDYIRGNDVFVYETDKTIVGYYSTVDLREDQEVSGVTINKGFWLDHMFVVPACIGCGVGTRLFDHLRIRCTMRGIDVLGILADPNARAFYEKMGCRYLREHPSTIANRTTPLLILKPFSASSG